MNVVSALLPARIREFWTAHWQYFVMSAFALFVAARAVAGLHWPAEDDFCRDIGAAQSIRDGGYPNDPNFFGEVAWYNPLAPWLVAHWSALTHMSVAESYVVVRKFANLSAPTGFYVLGVRTLGRQGAIVALA